MANVLSIVTYKIFPAKLGGQKGIAFFNQYFSKQVNLFCFTIKENDPSYASYRIFNEMRNHPLRYINLFYFARLKRIKGNNAIAPDLKTVSVCMPVVWNAIAINEKLTMSTANIPTFQISSFFTVHFADSNNLGNNPGRKRVLKKKLAALTKPISNTKYPSFGDARKLMPKG